MIAHALVQRPFCVTLLTEPAGAPAGRYFAAYRARGAARWLLGQGVVDEFGTFSSPIFLAPETALGRIYDFGIALGTARDLEMGLDAGWPPICLGVAAPAPPMAADWEEELTGALRAAAAGTIAGESGELGLAASSIAVGAFTIERWARDGEVSIVATDAPLLPRQLGRLCDAVEGDLIFAYSTGNRLVAGSGPLIVEAAGEAALAVLTAAAANL